MRHPKHDDADLAEVKAILGRLQRISRKPGEGRAQNAVNDLASLPALQVGTPESMADGSRSVTANANTRRLATAAIVLALLIAVVTGVVIFGRVGGPSDAVVVKERRADVAPQNPVPGSTPAQEVQQPPAEEVHKPLALHASDLMASGQVQAARAALLRAMQDDSADVAFALALSYDPNYLATIPAADAGPDVAEAKRWYRTWYDIAVKQGLVSDSVPLERIIRSMN
jgi:hypothetical protein